MIIRPITEADFTSLRRIYLNGIATGHATFETTAPGWHEWHRSHLTHSRLIALTGDEAAGWAALSPVSSRCVYGGVAEVSVYVATAHQSKGIGRMLLRELVSESEKNGIWTLEAGIFPENKASIRIHEQCGFRLVGRREKPGKINGVWKDVLFYERRSAIN